MSDSQQQSREQRGYWFPESTMTEPLRGLKVPLWVSRPSALPRSDSKLVRIRVLDALGCAEPEVWVLSIDRPKALRTMIEVGTILYDPENTRAYD